MLDSLGESLTIPGVKTKISSFSIIIIITFVWTSAYAATAPSQSANSFNVNCLPVSPVEAPTPTPAPAKKYTVTYGLLSAWCDGFIATVTIQNKGTAPIKGWTVRWNYTGNQSLAYSWNGDAVQSGKTVSVANASCNQTIPVGGSVCFGFQACYTGTNANPTVFTLQ